MASAQSPLVGLEMSPETATYVGLLERQVAAYAVQEAKFRALLELLTGDSWETTKLDMDGKMLMAIAVDALVKKAGMTVMQAKTVVSQRWNTVNQISTVPTPSSITIEEMVSQVAQSKNDTVVSPPVSGLSMAQRLADWQARQSSSVPTEPSVEPTEDPVLLSDTPSVPNTPADLAPEEATEE